MNKNILNVFICASAAFTVALAARVLVLEKRVGESWKQGFDLGLSYHENPASEVLNSNKRVFDAYVEGVEDGRKIAKNINDKKDES